MTLLTSQLLSNPVLYPQPVNLVACQRVFRIFYTAAAKFAEFEHEAHRLEETGEPLTADRLDDVYRGLKAEYYEPAVVDDRIAREWMRT